MAALTAAAFAKWLDGYGQASADRDAQAAASLFSPDARYYETPFDDPLAGREAIYRYWSRAAQNLRSSQFSYQILAVTGNLGLARWQATLVTQAGKQVGLDGMIAAEFDDDLACSLFREWWHRREIAADPGALPSS